MRTPLFILMLVAIGAVYSWLTRKLLAESAWYALPPIVALIFGAVIHNMLRRPGVRARRRALLLGVGVLATSATIAFATFVWTLIQLLTLGSWSSDAVWIVAGGGAGTLAGWLWSKFYRIFRKT